MRGVCRLSTYLPRASSAAPRRAAAGRALTVLIERLERQKCGAKSARGRRAAGLPTTATSRSGLAPANRPSASQPSPNRRSAIRPSANDEPDGPVPHGAAPLSSPAPGQRAVAGAHDVARARQDYEKFFALRKDAGPGRTYPRESEAPVRCARPVTSEARRVRQALTTFVVYPISTEVRLC